MSVEEMVRRGLCSIQGYAALAPEIARQQDIYGEQLGVAADAVAAVQGVGGLVSGTMVGVLESAIRAASMAAVDQGLVDACQGWLEWAQGEVAEGRVQPARRSSRGRARRHEEERFMRDVLRRRFDPASDDDEEVEPPSYLFDEKLSFRDEGGGPALAAA